MVFFNNYKLNDYWVYCSVSISFVYSLTGLICRFSIYAQYGDGSIKDDLIRLGTTIITLYTANDCNIRISGDTGDRIDLTN